MFDIAHGQACYNPLLLSAQAMKAGSEVCVTVTLLDSLVLARAAFFHSMNYRSVVVFGKPEVNLPSLDMFLFLGNACKGPGNVFSDMQCEIL